MKLTNEIYIKNGSSVLVEIDEYSVSVDSIGIPCLGPEARDRKVAKPRV